MSLKLALIVPDSHIPFEDKRAYDLMIKVATELQPDEIVILGDYADFYSVMSHQKDPTVFTMLKEEIEAVNARLDELDVMFPKATKVFIEGNHEYRLERYLLSSAPALFGVTETRNLLGIDKRPKWRFCPYGPNQQHQVLHSYLTARHEPLASSAKATAAKALCSLVYGHIHRIEESHIVGLHGANHVCFSVGWLGNKKLDRVFGYTKGHAQWQLGFGLVYVDPKSRLFFHQKIHIIDYKCVVNGIQYRG